MFRFKVEYFDTVEHKDNSDKGILGATSYAAACDELIKYYGADNILSIYLYELESPLTDDAVRETVEKG